MHWLSAIALTLRSGPAMMESPSSTATAMLVTRCSLRYGIKYVCRLGSALALHKSQFAVSPSLSLSLSLTHTHAHTHTHTSVCDNCRQEVCTKGPSKQSLSASYFQHLLKIACLHNAPHQLVKKKLRNGGTTTTLLCAVQMVDTRQPA